MPNDSLESTRAWVLRRLGGVSVRYKILGIVLSLVAVLGLSVAVQVRGILTRALDSQLQQQANAVALDLASRAERAVESGDRSALVFTLAELRLHNEAVSYARIIDSAGLVIAETAGSTSSDSPPPGSGVTEERIGFEGGEVRVGMLETEAQGVVEAVTGQILLSTLSFAVMAVVAASGLTWILTRPLKQLTAAARAIAAGQPAAEVPRWADDEFGDLAEAFNAMNDALDQAALERAERKKLQDRFVGAVIDAQEDERKRVARELHDGTSQSLTSLIIGIKNVADVAESNVVKTRVEELRDVAVDALDEIHSLATRLRPPVLDDLGLAAALERYVDECRARFSIRIDLVTLGPLERLPVAVETAVYRIVQEAMTNVIRHARAKNVGVVIERHSNLLRVGVEDDGEGFDPMGVSGSGHLGLVGMRERAELLGGVMRIDSLAGTGTTVTIEIPFPAGEAETTDA
jgi:signal transduction histidine kinase